MKLQRIASTLSFSLIALAVATVPSRAQDDHKTMTQQQPAVAEAAANTLVQIVRQATERFKDVNAAKAAGYQLNFGCVSADENGAMGLHYVNGDIVASGILDPTRPQIVVYEAMPDGSLKLTGVDFLVMAD